MRRQRFLLVVITVLLLWYALLGNRLLSTTDWVGEDAWLAWGILAIPFLAMLYLPLAYWRGNRRADTTFRKTAIFAAYGSVGYASFLFTLIVIRDGLALGVRLFGSSELTAVLFGATPTLGLAGFGGMFLVGYVETVRTPRVRRVAIPIEKLPIEWEGFTIAQISDLHVGYSVRRKFIEGVTRTLEALAPDAIAVTGDLADGVPEHLHAELEPFARLRPPSGTYYVPGNHEFYWGVDGWIAEVKRLGMRPLVNTHHVLRRGDTPLVFAGVNDYIARNFPGAAPGDAVAAFRGAPESAVRILLAHQPRFISDIGALSVDLQLSGHTHGGQFLPWIFVVGFFNPVARGLKRFGKTWVYVNPGTGYWGPPLRLGAAAEITLLRLTRA